MNIREVDFNFKILDYSNTPKEIVLHHAAVSSCTPIDINYWHKANGWSGIGYHYFVRKNGEVYKGRPDNAIGAHCSGYNTNTLGVCFEGNFEMETIGETQRKSGLELIEYIKNLHGINKVSYHKDHYATSCPGKNFNLLDNNAVETVTKPSVSIDNWISKLQAECNNQGFSSQVVDGVPGPATLRGCPTIKYGASGNITKLLQQRLVDLGYNTNGVDGLFGNGTRNAVVQFQTTNSLSADGIVGQNTWSKILGL